MRSAERLPPWVWLLPLGSTAAAVVCWTLRGGTVNGIVVGGALIALSGFFVFAFALEVLPRGRRLTGALRRWLLAVALGCLASAASLTAAGLGLYLVYRPFG